MVKKQLWLCVGLILIPILLNADCFAESDVYISRRYNLSRLRQISKLSTGSIGVLRGFGLTAPKLGLRSFNVDDQCGLEECLEQQIPGDHWISKKSELVYTDDEVVIHQRPEVHEKIKALLDRLSIALLRPMQLEIRRYKYCGENALHTMRAGAPLTRKESQQLKTMILGKTVQLTSRETLSLRDGEVRVISNLIQSKLLYNDRNDVRSVVAESIELTSGEKTTVSALRSRDGRSVDLKLLFEKAKLTELTMQRHDSFFLQK
ncbi:MAG: hypothetical protein P1V97_35565, partial [Planctomycetota bacterium]|nr:hypothetical protein [Planctomycetota bacterium]